MECFGGLAAAKARGSPTTKTMSEIQQLINEIKGFMSGNNRSYTPRLKKMYEGYREQCAELAEMLAQCRALIQKGMLSDARSLNLREKPSLTERFEILNFPGRQEFIDLCVDYGLQPMPEWDEKAVHELKAPVSASDANMASLMQQWRKIGRTGTAAQRIQVLRQIVASAPPNNAAWKRNLAEAEKTRYAEIGEELPQLAGRPDELDQLEKISLELFSPDQLIRPNDDLLHRFKEQLFPLQRKRLAAEMEKTLDEMQLGYESHDVRAIKAAYATWKRLISSPMAEIQPGQEQTVQDAMAYVERVEAEEADKSRYKQLMDELLQLLEKNAPYPEMERVYGALQRLERELPQSLVDQMRVREEDFRETERRQHVRRCLFGVTAAVIFLVLTFIGIQLLLYRNNVRQACNELARQKEEGLYEEGLALYENLKTTRPRIAQNSKVMVLQAEIRQALDERNAEIAASQQEFAQILQSVERFSSQKHYESKELDEMVARAEAIKEYLSDEQRQQYIRMKETIFEAKEKIRENRNDHFLEECDAFQKEVAELRSRIQENHDTAMELHRKAFDTLSSLKERILATDNIDSSLKASRKNLMESSLEVITATLAVEETYRRYVNVLESPRSLDEYLAALDFSPEIPEELRLAYARASSRMEQWRTDNEDFAHPSESLEKYVKSHPLPSDGSSLTLLYSEFKGAYLLTGPDPIRDSLTALLSSCDL